MANMSPTLGFDFYHQILANVRFVSSEHAHVRIITSREMSGSNFRVAVVRKVDMGRHREVVLSETNDSVHMALRALHLRSAEAVHNHIAMYGFDFPPEPKKQHGTVRGSDDEAASGFSVGESTVALSGVISNDSFSDEDVAVEFEDDEGKAVEAVEKIENLVSELAITGDEKSEPKPSFPELKVTPASPPIPAANSSKLKARKIRGPRGRRIYARSRSRSKSSAPHQPLQIRSVYPEPPPPPPVGGARGSVDGTTALQQYHQLRALDQLGTLPALPYRNPNIATNVPFITAKPINIERQSWGGEYTSHIPTHQINNAPQTAAMLALSHRREQITLPPTHQPPSENLIDPSNRPQPSFPALNCPGGYVQGPPPRILPAAPPPLPRLPNLATRQSQPDPQPVLHDVLLHITWAGGRGVARVLERCVPSRRAIIDAALAYARTNPAAFTELQPRRRWDGHWGSDSNKLMKGTLKRAVFRNRKNSPEDHESYDMTTYLGEDLSRLFDAAGGAACLVFVVELSVGAYSPAPFVNVGPGGSAVPGPGNGFTMPLPASDPPASGGSGPAASASYRDFASEDEEIIDD